jgi:endonuclease/exonuclease/phosphatase family metal-dependent hydrolase
VRGSKAKPVADRFDYLFVSRELKGVHSTYDYEAGTEAGSDHALVRVELVLDHGQPHDS